jgi:hypothetical protein
MAGSSTSSNVESRRKATGGKWKAKRRVECLHFENHPATPRSHVSVARFWPLHESSFLKKQLHVASYGFAGATLQSYIGIKESRSAIGLNATRLKLLGLFIAQYCTGIQRTPRAVKSIVSKAEAGNDAERSGSKVPFWSLEECRRSSEL